MPLKQMDTKKKYGYGKLQRLKSRKLIDAVFKEGKSLSSFPLRMYYLPVDHEQYLQAGVGASKRFFPHAVDRNRIKRVMRESWRLQKNELENTLKNNDLHLSIFINYTGKELPPKDMVVLAMKKCLQKLMVTIIPSDEHEEN